MNKERNTIIQEKLRLVKEVRFTIKGHTEYGDYNKETKKFDKIKKVFRVNEKGDAIYRDRLFGDGMNVNKWGPTCVTLYSFDMFGRRIRGKIKYSDIEIIEKVK